MAASVDTGMAGQGRAWQQEALAAALPQPRPRAKESDTREPQEPTEAVHPTAGAPGPTPPGSLPVTRQTKAVLVGN